MYYLKYNDIDLTELVKVREVEIPSLPTMEHSNIEVFERDGGVYNGLSYKTRDIRLTFIIQPDNPKDYDIYVADIKRAFYTKEERALFCGDETLYMMCVPVDDIYINELGNACAECEVNLISYDPYWYSTEVQLQNSSAKTFTVTNNGDMPTYLNLGVGISGKSTFVQLENKTTDEKILLGKLPSVEKKPTPASSKILYDPMESTSGWFQSDATIDSGRAIGGTIAVNEAGEGLKCGNFGSKSASATWHGACYRKNLDKAVTNFKVRITMHHNSTGTNGDPTKKIPYKDDDSQTTSGATTTYYVVKTSPTCNVRKSASTKASIIGTLKYGSKITNYTSSGNWLKIDYNGATGYVHKSVVRLTYGTTTVTINQCNFVTTKNTQLRANPKDTSINRVTIPAGTCIRCIYSTKYPTDGDGKGKYYKLAKTYSGKTGYVLIDDLVRASNYVVEYEDMYETADDKTGVCTLYGFSADGTQLFSMSMIDDNEYYEFTYPLIRKNNKDFLYDKTTAPAPKTETTYSGSGYNFTATKKYTLSGKYGDWNDFYGELYIERIKNKWYSYVKKIKDGNVLKTIKTKTVTDTTNSDKDLAYVVMYIGTTGDADKASGMSLNLVEVKQDGKNSTEDTTGIDWQEFEEGDAIEIDTSVPIVWLNNNEVPELIDVGSEFFQLRPGENELRIVTDDAKPVVYVAFQERYL
ncbi:MAG: SH3 domain-containing protein [Romboutsia timonensis]